MQQDQTATREPKRYQAPAVVERRPVQGLLAIPRSELQKSAP